MPEISEPETKHSPQDDAELKGPFNLAALIEAKAQKELQANFGGDGQDLAQRLAVAKSLDNDALSVRLGYLHNIGDLSHTKAFADYRSKLMEAFPDLKDVSFAAWGTELYPKSAYVNLWLKNEPAPTPVPLPPWPSPPKQWWKFGR